MVDLKRMKDGSKKAGVAKITYEKSSDGSALQLDPTMGETRQQESNTKNECSLPPI
jgi:hypothetical protein